MKKLHYIILAALCTVMAACMDGDWEEPIFTQAPYGNNGINEENIVSIAQLKADYITTIRYNRYEEIKTPTKIKARVSGNDIGGNIYKQLYVQDETGAILIAINSGGLNGQIAEGQEIIIDLQGLYIGGYGKMPQIGTPYENNGSLQIGRMPLYVWEKHYKVVNPMEAPIEITPVDFNEVKDDIEANAGKLVVLKNVTFAAADGKKTLIDGELKGGNFYNLRLNGMNNVIVRTSSYADFAKTILPYDTIAKQALPCTIIGIASRFDSDWQIMIRKTKDIQ